MIDDFMAFFRLMMRFVFLVACTAHTHFLLFHRAATIHSTNILCNNLAWLGRT